MTEVTETLPTRDQVPEELKWDYKAMYPDEAQWEADFRTIAASQKKLASFKGKMCKSGETLLAALRADDEVSLLLDKLYAYASMRNNEDMKNTKYSEMLERAKTLYNDIVAATSYMRPELVAIIEKEPEKLAKWVETVDGLALYKLSFDRLDRARKHTRSDEVEQVLGSAGKVLSAPDTIHEAMVASLKFPKIADKDGKLVQVEDDNLNSRWLRSKDRGERQRGFHAVMRGYDAMRDVFAACYSAHIDSQIFSARQRRFGSTMESALGPKNIPTSVYTALIEGVHANLPVFHRYLELKKRLLGVKELRLYDLYVDVNPLAGAAQPNYNWQQTVDLILPALAPLGEEYVAKFKQGIVNRWFDVMQTKNKRGGAWGGGGYYGSYPYSLLNHHGDLESVFTAAHEGGHCMHSLYSRETQPQQYAQYVIFVAEVASTLNEALLQHHLLANATDPAVRLSLLNKALEGVRGTVFRQTLFAEFEMEAHKLAEKGKPLSADVLSRLYRRLYRKYYGAACVIDRDIGAEWMRIPHFYSSFYVYQYAIGHACSQDLASQLLTQGEPARNRIINNFLRVGGVKDPIEIMQDAGTDPATSHPINNAMKVFAEQLDMFERELNAIA